MKKCVVQLLQGKTRILCTHRLEFVDQADTVVLMEEGTIVRTGGKNVWAKNSKKKNGCVEGEDEEGIKSGVEAVFFSVSFFHFFFPPQKYAHM